MGEIHLDHCRVNYTKDRFDRSDPAWQEMFTFVHGDTSLWPERAKAGGTNDAPLFKLFQGYRRAYRKNVRKDGGYTLSLAVPDNARAIEMSERFYDGDLEYQADAKWYELSEEEDERLLRERQKTENATKTEGQTSDPLPGFGVPGSAQPSGEAGTSGAATSEPGEQPSSKPEQSPIPIRRARKTLWGEYLDDQTKIPWNVQAYEVGANDPGLGGPEHPWSVTKNNKGITEFLYNPDHEIFRSATLTPLDALLYALSYMAVDFHNSKRSVHITHDVVLAALREKYTKNSQLNPIMLAGESRQVLRDVARSLRRNIEEGDGQPLFMELSIADREATQKRMAARLGTDPQPAISDGSFLEYAPYPVLIRFLESHPEFFFDGGFWDTVYSGLDGAYSADIEEVQNDIVRRYSSMLTDAAWLADQDATDVETGSRDRLLRAWLAVELLKEGVVEDGY